jgi:RNA polymerase sigma-70 factor, ECF subfamily
VTADGRSTFGAPQAYYCVSVAINVASEELALAILPRKSTPNRGAFERLMAEHERLVLGVAWRMLGRMEDAQDAAQEVFLRLFKNFDEVAGDPKPWLYRVTVNVCNDYFRRRVSECEPPAGLADTAPDPLRILTDGERKRLLLEGLQTLGERERAAVILRDMEGLSTSEVAGILGVEEVTVRSQISMAKVKLAKYVRSRK